MTKTTSATTAADRLASVLRPALAATDVRLYDVEVSASGGTRTLRVLVDRDEGVDLDAVTRATEALAPVLDTDSVVAAALPGTYLLEVSSPGVERPLRTPDHFRGAIGAPVSLKRRTPAGARRDRVVVVAADDAAVDVDVDGSTERIEYGDIVQARTVFEWGPAPKPGKARTTKPRATARTDEDATR